MRDRIVERRAMACSYFSTIPNFTVIDLKKALRLQKAFRSLPDKAT
jgi:hypothetical protein